MKKFYILLGIFRKNIYSKVIYLTIKFSDCIWYISFKNYEWKKSEFCEQSVHYQNNKFAINSENQLAFYILAMHFFTYKWFLKMILLIVCFRYSKTCMCKKIVSTLALRQTWVK